MNYIKELNAFRDWLLLNELSTSEIALWHALMTINNMTGWQEWFTAPNQTVQRLTGLSKQGLDNTRNGLKTKGLILYEKGKRGQSGKYKMISLVNKLVNSVDQIVDQTYDQCDDQCDDQSDDQSYAYDLTINKHKQKQNNILLQQSAHANEPDPVLVYEREIGDFTDIIKDDFMDWLHGGYFDEPKLIMIEAIKEAAIHEKRSWAYVVKVLRRCLQQNVRTLEQFRQAKAEFEKTKAAKVTPIHSGRRQGSTSGEPTWQDDPPKSHYGRLEV